MRKKYPIFISIITIMLLSTSLSTAYLLGNINFLSTKATTDSNICSNAYVTNWTSNGIAICTEVNSQSNPVIIIDGSGGAIITWSDSRADAGNIYIQKIHSNGTPLWGANGLAVCTETLTQAAPSICIDGAGGAIITWQDSRPGSNGFDIYAQWITAAGTIMWDPNGTLICNAAGSQINPQIMFNMTNAAIIAWEDFRGADYNIYAQKINSSGITEWDANGTSLCSAGGDQEKLVICSDGSGGIIAAWRDERDDTTGDIYVQGIESDKSLKWTVDGVHIANGTIITQDNPDICYDGAGGAIITWQDARSGTSYDIYGQWINSAGTVQWAANGTAIYTVNYSAYSPKIVRSGDFATTGSAIVTWWDIRGADEDIYAQKLDNTGNGQWIANGTPICTATDTQQQPDLCIDGSGGAIIAWGDERSGNCDIYVQWINSTGVVQWKTNGEAVCTATGDQVWAKMCPAGAKRAIISWHDSRSGVSGMDIYAQKVINGTAVEADDDDNLLLLLLLMAMMGVDPAILILFYMLVEG
jgi:hypothetical protein